MKVLGKTSPEKATEFIKQFPNVSLGSLSSDGSRRLMTSSTGEQLEKETAAFAAVAITIAAASVDSPSEPLECSHRGSKRNTCCGSPSLWICRYLDKDCVATDYDRNLLMGMVATQEAQEVASCSSCPHRSTLQKKTIPQARPLITVVIPSHKYGKYLRETIQSLKASTLPPNRIIVVEDSSSDEAETICDEMGAEYLRVDFGDVHKTRAFGFERVDSKYVLFLDADDKVKPEYLEEAVGILEADRQVAIAFPRLEYFDGGTGLAHGTIHSPKIVTSDDLECRNWIPAGSVIRADLIRQTLAFKTGTINPKTNWSQDWRVAKTILRAHRAWKAVRTETTLLYRKHGSNMSSRDNSCYWSDADFENEPVTISIAFSGRWEAWALLREWLFAQTWPRKLVRLLIINSTHFPLSASKLGLENWEGSIQIERIDLGSPGLADIDRRPNIPVRILVNSAVAAAHNFAAQVATTEYMLYLEDDVVPKRPDVIETMLRSMDHITAAISGVYRQRYQAKGICAFHLPVMGDGSFLPMEGDGVEVIGGSGFGCLLVRRSLLRRFPLSADGPGDITDYDIAFSTEVKNADGGRWKWKLHRGVQCDHLLNE